MCFWWPFCVLLCLCGFRGALERPDLPANFDCLYHNRLIYFNLPPVLVSAPGSNINRNLYELEL